MMMTTTMLSSEHNAHNRLSSSSRRCNKDHYSTPVRSATAAPPAVGNRRRPGRRRSTERRRGISCSRIVQPKIKQRTILAGLIRSGRFPPSAHRLALIFQFVGVMLVLVSSLSMRTNHHASSSRAYYSAGGLKTTASHSHHMLLLEGQKRRQRRLLRLAMTIPGGGGVGGNHLDSSSDVAVSAAATARPSSDSPKQQHAQEEENSKSHRNPPPLDFENNNNHHLPHPSSPQAWISTAWNGWRKQQQLLQRGGARKEQTTTTTSSSSLAAATAASAPVAAATEAAVAAPPPSATARTHQAPPSPPLSSGVATAAAIPSAMSDDMKNGSSSTTTATTSAAAEESVHLQLNHYRPAPDEVEKELMDNNNIDDDDDKTSKKNSKPPSTIQIHTYTDLRQHEVWMALSTSPHKFAAYLRYCGLLLSDDTTASTPLFPLPPTTGSGITTTTVTPNPQLREEWRNLWKAGRLLTDRTELLAVYPSDEEESNNHRTDRDLRQAAATSSDPNDNSYNNIKRGGFADLLFLYTDRLMAILVDEQGDRPQNALRAWLQEHFGQGPTEQLEQLKEANNQYEKIQQRQVLKEFLEWFRTHFPYYYDRCGSCGASIKEDTANNDVCSESQESDVVHGNVDDGNEDGAGDGDDDDDDEHETFIGYVYPNQHELKGKASRTELYQCHRCHAFTRFPRYNSASHVMAHKRGRCGEYSMLLFRFLRALGHECRWVVDWADHVWVEIRLGGTWIHLDPCEAAVGENLIYQDWGKKQTYVLGFYLPPARTTIDNQQEVPSSSFPLIEDITQEYTSDTWSEICKRREGETEEHVQTAIKEATAELETKLRLQNNSNVNSSNNNENKVHKYNED